MNAPEPSNGNENGVDDGQVDSPEDPPAHLPPQTSRPGIPQNPHMPPYMPNVQMDPQQALAYQNYVQQRGNQYGMPPQSSMPQHASHQS